MFIIFISLFGKKVLQILGTAKFYANITFNLKSMVHLKTSHSISRHNYNTLPQGLANLKTFSLCNYYSHLSRTVNWALVIIEIVNLKLKLNVLTLS